ncbi:hypothetical protein [Flavobacterium sp. YO12]|uniref:hypothetical protein n=1 Tax=Flavobacterium sp. YO12 TaxID=1920029 RepID=UPI00100C06F0|nr:hypothetical protein [Flavobacterium sp. YO12]RXM49200.1 hypothetical protein BOW55_02340 [Flavobacterium sp. YO12]
MSNIIFGEPRFAPPKEDDKEANDVYMGVFFDGTSNNRENIEGRRKDPSLKNSSVSDNDGSNTSYGNDNSNVDRLEKAYLKDSDSHYYSVYVEGIGTKNPKKMMTEHSIITVILHADRDTVKAKQDYMKK